MPSKSLLKGANRLRRNLRTLPNSVHDELRESLEGVGARQFFKAQAETPRRTGGLASAIKVKVLDRSLTLKIGLLTKSARRKYFYGFILDHGRKAKTVQVRRRGTRYALRVRAIARGRYDFVFGRVRDIRANELSHLRDALTRALAKVAGGGGND